MFLEKLDRQWSNDDMIDKVFHIHPHKSILNKILMACSIEFVVFRIFFLI